jgi:hypothetical protein
MSLAAALVLATGPRRLTLYLAVPALGLGAAGIVATASRSGWMTLLLIGFLTVLAAPIARYTKLKLTVATLLVMGTLLGLLLWQGGTDAERVKSLSQGVQVIGQREFLIRAGIEMWKDSPLIGLGSGNYERSLIASYLDLIPYWARTTLSHTSLVSLLAELGLVGLSVFVFAAARVGMVTGVLYRRATSGYRRLLLGWLGASFIGIVVQSQSEGRLLDEPYLWLLLALLIALETSPGLRDGAIEFEGAEGVVAEPVGAAASPKERQRPLAPIPAPASGAS